MHAQLRHSRTLPKSLTHAASDALATHRLSDNVQSMALQQQASNQRLACLRQCCQTWLHTAGILALKSCSCKVLHCRLYNWTQASLAAKVSCAFFKGRVAYRRASHACHERRTRLNSTYLPRRICCHCFCSSVKSSSLCWATMGRYESTCKAIKHIRY